MNEEVSFQLWKMHFSFSAIFFFNKCFPLGILLGEFYSNVEFSRNLISHEVLPEGLLES
jgi:hypothetical protein